MKTYFNYNLIRNLVSHTYNELIHWFPCRRLLLKCKFVPRSFTEFIIIFERYLVKGKMEILIIFVIDSGIEIIAKSHKNRCM